MRYSAMGLALAMIVAPVSAADQSGAKQLERQLRQAVQADPDDAVALARLARIYMTTDRAQKAQRLYRGMLSLDAVILETADGATLSSHDLARRSMIAMGPAKPVRLGSR